MDPEIAGPRPPLPGPPPVDPSGVAVGILEETVMVTVGPMITPIMLEVWQFVDVEDPIDDGYSLILTYVATVN